MLVKILELEPCRKWTLSKISILKYKNSACILCNLINAAFLPSLLNLSDSKNFMNQYLVKGFRSLKNIVGFPAQKARHSHCYCEILTRIVIFVFSIEEELEEINKNVRTCSWNFYYEAYVYTKRKRKNSALPSEIVTMEDTNDQENTRYSPPDMLKKKTVYCYIGPKVSCFMYTNLCSAIICRKINFKVCHACLKLITSLGILRKLSLRQWKVFFKIDSRKNILSTFNNVISFF